ncbi:hypothetical protein CapIbe_017490 [Capra ibex]
MIQKTWTTTGVMNVQGLISGQQRVKGKKGTERPRQCHAPATAGLAQAHEALCRVSLTHGFGLTTPVKWLFSTSPESRTKTPHRQLFSLDIRKRIDFLLKKWILYSLSHQGSPKMLEWAACPFSRGTS